jgi:hypothetical protein
MELILVRSLVCIRKHWNNIVKYMRTASLKGIIAGLVVGAVAGLASVAQAQQTVTLVPYNASWRYNQSGADQGTAWRTNTFSDASWASGLGLLQGGEGTAYPEPFNTTLLQPDATRITYYFRHTFSYAGTLSGITLWATNYCDDGAVIYLNGMEAARIRVPAGQTATTLASGGPATEGTPDIVSINPALLRSGQNVLAVEVHQNAPGSSDIVWGNRLVVVQPTALNITQQPQSQTAIAGDSVTFSVGITGGPATYQWQKDQVNINGATAATYTINPVTTASAGTYRVIVSNALGSRTSSNAVLTVFADTEGPTMLSAVVQDSGQTNNIDLTVDEAVLLATANTNTIRVIRSGTFGANAQSVIVSNVLVSGRTIRLRVGGSNWRFFDNYYILVNGLADARGNLTPANSVIPVSWRVRTNVIQMSATWDYYAANWALPPEEQNFIYTNNNWFKTNYVINPNFWGTDAGIFWFDQDATTNLCAGDGLNPLPIGFFDYSSPLLFRTTFNLGTNFGTSGYISGALGLRNFVDDGFVVYLNGQPIYTNNIPAGGVPITKDTRATQAINPQCVTNIEVSVTNLLPRTNWLAVGVVSQTGVDGDMYFGLEIDGIFLRNGQVPTNGLPNNLRLTATRQGNNAARLTWPNTGTADSTYYGFILEEAAALGIPGSNTTWLSVSNQSNGVTVSGQPARFYRLRKGPNSSR